MSFFDTLQEATQRERHELFNLPIIRDALEGKVSLDSYRAFLAQAYYHVRHTVPLLMATGGYGAGSPMDAAHHHWEIAEGEGEL